MHAVSVSHAHSADSTEHRTPMVPVPLDRLKGTVPSTSRTTVADRAVTVRRGHRRAEDAHSGRVGLFARVVAVDSLHTRRVTPDLSLQRCRLNHHD